MYTGTSFVYTFHSRNIHSFLPICKGQSVIGFYFLSFHDVNKKFIDLGTINLYINMYDVMRGFLMTSRNKDNL